MDTDILVSVIVPAYNVAEWIPRCLESILTQTYTNLEIIVIDDGSTDETPGIVNSYGEKDHRIKVIHQSNKGLVASRERGIIEARGEYIGFVDGDDEIIPEMYEKLVKNALEYSAQISQCGILYCFYDGRRKPIHGTGVLTLYNRFEGCKALLKGDVMEPSLCNKLYLASLLKDSCLDRDVVNNEDMLRNIVLFNRAERSVMEDFCGYLYWRRNDSMSNNLKVVESGKNILKARKQICEYVPAELRNIAYYNYIMGAINIYNTLIGVRTKEAHELRKECMLALKNSRKSRQGIPFKTHMYIFAIRYFSSVYGIARRFHIKRRNRRNKEQAAKLQSTTGMGNKTK